MKNHLFLVERMSLTINILTTANFSKFIDPKKNSKKQSSIYIYIYIYIYVCVCVCVCVIKLRRKQLPKREKKDETKIKPKQS